MKLLWDSEKVERTLKRITHEIIERQGNLEDIVLFGIAKKGIIIAEKIGENLAHFEKVNVPVHPLDITGYRDDRIEKKRTLPDIDVTGKHVILLDDVLYTGRTVRAALAAIVELGRPATIQFGVLVDRGHRELPVRADYVGMNVPTRFNESIFVDLKDKKGVFLTTIEEE